MEEQKNKLWELCKKFIEDHRISCGESTCGDQVYIDAPELVGDIAEIVGYYKYEDE